MQQSTAERKMFDSLYAQLIQYRKQPSVQARSDVASHNDHPAYREIVKRGKVYLPFIVEKLKQGDFFLNQAMKEITGVDIYSCYKDAKVTGEQDVAQLWLRWWDEKKDGLGRRQ